MIATRVLLILLCLGCMRGGFAYPLDGHQSTGIRRLEAMRLIEEGKLKGRRQARGASLTTEQVDLRLLDRPGFGLPPVDIAFTRQLAALLGQHGDAYGLSVLDLSDPQQPRYAEHGGTTTRNPGSAGKLIVALALFQALADAYPNDIQARDRVLRNTPLSADEFIISDRHDVLLWDPARQQLAQRPLQQGDRGNLWEYLDWMLSASSNAAASIVMKQAMLVRRFGTAYPVTEQQTREYFSTTPPAQLGTLAAQTFQDPITRNGLDVNALRQGSFFTREGKRRVPGTTSHATSRELMRFLLRMEQGKLVDTYSSRALKRLLYVTERRARYASSGQLQRSAVYYKSGSWYSCQPEPGFACESYKGNIRNFMTSTVIVESPADEPKLYYLVTLMSNVLRKNSALDHQRLASEIHQLIKAAHD